MGWYEYEDPRAAAREAESRIQRALSTGATELNLSRLGLTALPDSLGRLAGLRALDLHKNRLESGLEILGGLQQLRTLDLSHNRLTSLAPALERLTGLQALYLLGNQLESVPEALRRMTQLRVLSLAVNQLTVAPDFLGNLAELQWLYLDHNQLESLPPSLGALKQLQRLDLSANRLSALPESLYGLAALERLYLHGNDGLGLPVELLGPLAEQVTGERARPAKPGDILGYYFRVRKAKRPLNEAKLILVGRGGVGKTSLVHRLVHNRFNPNEKWTAGICISEWPLRLHGGEEVRLNVWDFGGQENMHATHQFFLTQRSLYLLVLEGRKGAEEADAEYWLKLIESFGTESSGEVSPVLVVLNKIKANPFDINRRALQQKYPCIRGFLTTDCEDGTGMSELRAAIEHETDQLKHLRDAFPTSWFAIKDRLAGMKQTLKRSYISFDEYRRICADNNETDPQAQEALAFYLHSLGIALNYRDDARLRDMHVLDPHWITDGIYKILNAPQLAAQKGELRLDQMGDLLDAQEYPRAMHSFLFDLMKKFELCFAFPDDDTHYLIPELLDIQEPAEHEAFEPTDCLNFAYQYPVLPEGLLPRFIVRTHTLSTGLARWRTGVVLAFEGNQALVKGDVQDKRVSIAVSGPMVGRRRLLAIIRSDFERIHADISTLKPKAFVPLPNQPTQGVPYQKLLTFEAKNIQRFPEAVGNEVLELDVQELLNGVDLEGTRRRQKAPAEQPVRLFYSYSHKDETLRNKLETHLKLLQRTGLIEPWHDRNIEAGDDWKRRIDENLERADIILLLVSANFIASDYCYEMEMTRALERHQAGEAMVIPVVVRDVNWTRAPFAKLQALPKDAKAVMEWPSRDAAWRNVSEGIERVVERIRKEHR